jgi:predicted nucleic-acid-binding Zn-ribbon protein
MRQFLVITLLLFIVCAPNDEKSLFPKFKSIQFCIKCGTPAYEASMVYVKKGTECPDVTCKEVPEHLSRTCPKCGYTWNEAVAK